MEVAPVAIRVSEDPKCNSREQLLTGLGPAEIDIPILYFKGIEPCQLRRKMTKTLERRLARLEGHVPPDGPPETLEVQFVSADGKVTGTRLFEFLWCPPPAQWSESRWRSGPGYGRRK